MQRKTKLLLLENKLVGVQFQNIKLVILILKESASFKKITKISKDNWLAINGRVIKIDEISIEIPI